MYMYHVCSATRGEVTRYSDGRIHVAMNDAPVLEAPPDTHEFMLRGLLRTSGLMQHERALQDAGVTMAVIMDTPAPHLSKQLVGIGLSDAEVRKLLSANRQAEDVAVAWDNAHTPAAMGNT